MKRLLGFTVFALMILFTSGLHAADEIRIVRGTAFQPLNFVGDLSLQGTSGLRIDATLGDSSGSTWRFCELLACLPGDVIDIGTAYNSFGNVFGQVTIQGQTNTLGFQGAFVELNFDGTIVLPEFTDTTVDVTAPFTFSGSVEVPDRHEPSNSEVFQLQGSGVATVTLVRNLFFTGWVVSSVTYDFVPRGA